MRATARHPLVLMLAIVAIAGCASTDDGARVDPGPIASSPGEGTAAAAATGVTSASGEEPLDPTELQATLFGFADTYIALIGQAADNLMVMDRSARRRILAVRAKLDGSRDVVQIVTGPNPTVALLDLAVMVALQRQVWIEFWEPVRFKDEALNYMDALERLEKEIWRIAAMELDEAQIESLKALAIEIREQYSTQVYVTSLRASQITSDIGEEEPEITAPQNLLSAFGIDPLAGLSPAVAEVTKTRLLAERTFFYAQHLPTLIGWRVELEEAFMMSTPEVTGVLANVDSAVADATRLVELAETLPATITAERQAALDQASELVANEIGRLALALADEREALLAGVATEREALLGAFDERQDDARAVLADLRATIEAADQLSTSVRGVLSDVETLTAAPGGDVEAEPGRPFDIREYQTAIESATDTLRQLDGVVERAQTLVDSPKLAEGATVLDSIVSDLEELATFVVLLGAAAFGIALFLALAGASLVRRAVLGRAA